MCDQDHFEEDRYEYEARGLVTRKQFWRYVGSGNGHDAAALFPSPSARFAEFFGVPEPKALSNCSILRVFWGCLPASIPQTKSSSNGRASAMPSHLDISSIFSPVGSLRPR